MMLTHLAISVADQERSRRPKFFHFGFRCADAEQVRTQRARLLEAGVRLVEDYDTEAYVGVKCLDPDGYQVEVYWEPEAGA